MEDAGFAVIRFKNEEVMDHIDAVNSFLEDWIEKKVSSKTYATLK